MKDLLNKFLNLFSGLMGDINSEEPLSIKLKKDVSGSYNQIESDGLNMKIKFSQRLISSGKFNMSRGKRKILLDQNPKTTAKYLCNTVTRYLYMKFYYGVAGKTFSEFYLECIKNDILSATTVNRKLQFDYVQNEFAMIGQIYGKSSKFIKKNNYKEIAFSYFKNQEDMIEQFLLLDQNIALVRNQSHTYLILNIDQEAIIFDTYHSKWNLKPLRERVKASRKDKLKFIYWYEF